MPKRKKGTGAGGLHGRAAAASCPCAAATGDAWWIDLPERELRLSNLDKLFWPEEGYTKGDLLAYYFNVADLLLPHLERRPLTMKRMPDGVDGDSFYEKTAPSHTPEWVHRCTVLSEDAKEGRIDYLTVDDLATLLFVANLGAIEMHPLHSRCSDTMHPDYLFFDLDPFPPYTYEDVLTVARHIKVLLDQLGLAGVPEDERRDRHADLRAARGRSLDLRGGARVRRHVRAPDRARRPRPRDDGVADRRPHRQDLHRPQHEPAGREHRGRVFAAARAARAGLDAAHLGRGRRRAGSSRRTSGSTTCGNASRASATCGRRCARARRRISSEAMEALGVEAEDDPSGPLPRTAAKTVEAKTSDEIALASKDPALFEYVRRREFGPEGTTRAGAGRRGRRRELVRDPQASGDAAALRRAPRARRRRCPPGRCPRVCRRPRATSAWRCRPRIHPLEYGKFEGTIPEGHYGAGEVRIFDDGWYEPIEWTDTKVSFRLHGRRYPDLEFHFVKTRTRLARVPRERPDRDR